MALRAKNKKHASKRVEDDEDEEEDEDDEQEDQEEDDTPDPKQLSKELKQLNRKLGEFRQTNRGLYKENKTLKDKLTAFDGIEPDRLKKGLDALSKIEDEEDRKLIETGDVEKLVERRTKAMKGDYDTKLGAKDKALTEAQTTAARLKKELSALKNHNAVLDYIGEAGFKIKSGARKDVLGRIDRDWRIDDNGESKAGTDEEPIFGSDGDPITITEWTKEHLLGKASHLFEGGGGGGAEGSGNQKPTSKKLDVDAMSPREFGKHLEEIAGVKKKNKKA